MGMVTIEVRLPREIYNMASEILARQGLTMEDALILFLQETVRLGRIPFEYTEEDLEQDHDFAGDGEPEENAGEEDYRKKAQGYDGKGIHSQV